MNTQATQAYFSPEEYLELERQSQFKHECQRGLVYAMAGAKRSHVRVNGSLHILLGIHLADSPCEVYESDMKARLFTTRY